MRAGTDLGNYGTANTDIFNDIYVKEIQWIQAIQLLKRFDNDLEKFINSVVKYNSRFEKIDFSLLHRQLVEMGDLRKLQMKEGQHILNQKYATSENAYAERPLAMRRKTKRVKQLDENGKRATFWNHDYKVELGVKTGGANLNLTLGTHRRSGEYTLDAKKEVTLNADLPSPLSRNHNWN